MLLKLCAIAQLTALAYGQAILIPSDSFSSFQSHWNYLYPWGTDHNGGARMNKTQVSTDEGYLVLTSKPVTGQAPAHHGGNDIPINYLSGAVHAKNTFTVQTGGGFDFSAEFLAPVDQGTWPAFWLTAVEGWPPEIDVAEWKGSGDISFNTFNTSSKVTALDVSYPSPEDWHAVRAEIRDTNGRDISVNFYLDNNWVATQYGSDYVGAGMYFIINYQMEGSSGSPGPSTTTTYSVRNVVVTDYNL